MKEGVTLETLFDMSLTGEKIMHDFYLGLLDKFSNSPKVSAFWKKMAEDEIRHIQEIKDIRASRNSSQLQETIDPAFLSELKEELEFNWNDKLQSIKNLSDAYDVANDLETSEINKCFDLLKTKKGSSKDVRAFLTSTINEHINSLLECHDIFGDTKSMKKIVCNY